MQPTTLAEASQQIQTRRVSPLHLTRACLDRIERLNPRLNAFITVTAEQALREAAERTAELDRGVWRGPLHGIPIALKDLLDTAGVRTTSGSAIHADRIPLADAEVVTRLRKAGAISLGKLNMHEFAYGSTSAVSHFGPVRNAWNQEYISGGSSGGSAVAVAAGLCYGALGSDTGGSIRQPAAYNNLTGLKPTYGRVSNRGVVPLSYSMDHIGPICCTALDAALLLQPLAGYDAADPPSVDCAVPDYAAEMRSIAVVGLRVGVARHPFFDELNSEIEALIAEAIARIRQMVAGVVDIELPGKLAARVLNAEAMAVHQQHVHTMPERFQPITLARLQRTPDITLSEYVEGLRELAILRRAAGKLFDEVDIVLTPTTHVLPLPLNRAAEDMVGSTISLRNTRPFNELGVPTVSVPCGFSSQGLPVGLQLSAAPFAESTVLALAHAYEPIANCVHRRPSFNS